MKTSIAAQKSIAALKSLAAFISFVLTPLLASAQNYSWTNVRIVPDDLIQTEDAWSAVRIEDPQFTSYRIAADDFTLTETTQITTIGFWGVEVGTPPIFSGDWYIYENAGGSPGSLIAAGPDEPMAHALTGWTSPTFGDIYSNVMHPSGLVLPAGNYFLAFRTYQGYIPIGKHTNAAFTTRWANGAATAHWSFDVLPDGSVTGAWVPMSVFNLVAEQEWAFWLEGQTVSNCVPCDTNCDGSVNGFDIDPLVDLLTGGGTPCSPCAGNVNGNGSINGFDVDGFVAALSGGGC